MRTIQIQNWDSVARSRDIEKASQQITKAIADEGKNSQKIVEAVKTGSEKIVDAVSKVRIGNVATAPATSTPAAMAISTGLHSIAESTSQLAGHLYSNPAKIGAVAESAKGLNKQFSDLVEGAEKYAESANKLRAAASETVKASDWIGGQYSGEDGVSVNNSCGFASDLRVFNFR